MSKHLKRPPIHRLLLLLLLLAALTGQLPVLADDPSPAPPGIADRALEPLGAGDQDAWEWQVIRLVNQERADQSLPPLKFNANLRSAARAHSQDLGVDNYFAHDSYNYTGGSWAYVQSWNDRIQSYYGGDGVAENIAAGYDSPESVMAAWMGSEGHRENILSLRREIGVGYYYDASDAANIYCPAGCSSQYNNGPYYNYWVQDFGSRSDVYPVIIDSEAYSTTSRTVQLYVYGPAGALQMRFSNDNLNWSTWETYKANKTWSLASGSSGVRTVYAQVQDSTQTYSASDDIQYITEDPVLSVSPTTVTFFSQHGSGDCQPTNAIVQVTNNGDGDMDWSSSESSAWFQAADGADTVTLTCVASVVDDYPVSERSGPLTITAPDAVDSPQNITVGLLVVDQLYTVHLPSVSRGYSD
ncbi:MAG: CAP domain-containing protein [Chloroflexota bacterium]